MKLSILEEREHERGRLYEVEANGKIISVLLTFHALARSARWDVAPQQVLRTLIFPEEVLRGHRDRFIAQRRSGRHVVRVIYEYERRLPVAVTVYCPSLKRYFDGGGRHEDRILP
jgi:hypothetical protein